MRRFISNRQRPDLEPVEQVFELLTGMTYISSGSYTQNGGVACLGRDLYATLLFNDASKDQVWGNTMYMTDIDGAAETITTNTKQLLFTTPSENREAGMIGINGSTNKVLVCRYRSDGDIGAIVYTISKIDLSWSAGSEYTSTPTSDVRRGLVLQYIGNNKYVFYGRDGTSSTGTHYQVVITHNTDEDRLSFGSWAGNGVGVMGNTHINTIDDDLFVSRAATTNNYGVNTVSGTTITPPSNWYQVNDDNIQIDQTGDHTAFLSSGGTYLGVTMMGGISPGRRSYFKVDGTTITDITIENTSGETNSNSIRFSPDINGELNVYGVDGATTTLQCLREDVSYNGFDPPKEHKKYPSTYNIQTFNEIRSGMAHYEDITFVADYRSMAVFKNTKTE